MKTSRLASLVTAAVLSAAALVSTPVAGAEEPAVPIVQTIAERNTNPTPQNPDPDMAVGPTTPWLRILEASSQGRRRHYLHPLRYHQHWLCRI